MSDLIDRQAAIATAIKAAVDWHKLANPQYSIAYCIGEAMRQLPPASNSEIPNSSDTISRAKAIDIVTPHDDNRVMRDALEELPSAQPEIIRCKDCKHWIPYDWMFSEVWQSRNINDYPEDEIGCNYCDMAMKANDFCSRGERREVTE